MENNFDIAIIGMACRFPGANDLNSFWNNLANGVESISHFTDEELRQSGIPDALINNPNYVKASPTISEPGMFDASFFGFTPMEAKMMDPQHRILLECAQEALEHSGYDSEKYSGRIGVFTGSAMNTYFMNNILRSKFVDEYIPTLIGNDKDFLSTRISYKLNLKGPSINVQTACSTSLVAVHLACQNLISEESDMVLAGAVSVKAPHKAGYICDGGGIVSPDAHVRAFDAKANGTVFGSGCGIVVLKRLSDAISDGDTIHAVIKGSALNNDGSEKAGYTAPSVNSQADAVIEALSLAEIEAETITYLEAHGSGTPIGDPIELSALTKAFRNFTENSGFCAIGSVKTNVGHLDAAAGIAGLIKTVLSLKNKKIPPSINYSESNPEIDFTNSPFFVNTQLTYWKSTGPKRAGIMSTGMGGTNAYLILEEAPETKELVQSNLPTLLLLSAKSETALDQSTKQLSEFLNENDSVDIGNVAYTLQRGRKTFNHRRFLVCKNRNEAVEILKQEKSKRIFSGKLQSSSKRPVIFLLPGIGDHYVGMGYDLYKNVKVFKEEVDKCAFILNNYLDLDIRDILYPKDYNKNKPDNGGGIDLKKMLAGKVNRSNDSPTQKINQTLYAQPALFIIEFALAKLWMHLGITPDAIVGHSMGEYVAACLAGVFSLEDALKLITKRAKLVNDLPQGAMLAVTLSESELLPLLNKDISISLINGPKICVVAGPINAITEFEKVLKEKDILSRYVQNAHAFHSSMLDSIVDEFTEDVRKVKLNSPKIPYTSNLTGSWIKNEEATSPEYWAKHSNHTARFSDALYKIWQQPNNILVEVGPGKTLGILAMQHLDLQKNENSELIWSMRYGYENYSDFEFFIKNLGKLWLTGAEINWENFYQGEKHYRIPLPTYPFEKENFWIESKQNLEPFINRESKSDTKGIDELTLLKDSSNKNNSILVNQLLNSKKFLELLPQLIEAITELKPQLKEELNLSDLVYELAWKPQNNSPSTKPLQLSIDTSTLIGEIKSELSVLIEQPELRSYSKLLNELEALSVIYILKMFSELGWKFELRDRFDLVSLTKKLKVVSRQHRFLKRLLNIICDVGYLKQSNSYWEVISIPDIRENPKLLWDKLIAQYPQAKIELTLLERCGRKLGAVLQGESDPLELLFPEGDLASATALYQDSPAFKAMNTLLQSIVISAVNNFPENRKVKILEIGAGTGGTTSRILPHLSANQSEYVFTDVSKLFLHNASERFRNYSFVDYKILDIGKDPSKQGFDKESFDIIIASNAVHATENVSQTVINVKKMLVPGGLLLLLEGTAPLYWIDMFSGGLDGWWQFKDFDLRPSHPLMSADKWSLLLKENGYQNIEAIDPSTQQPGGLFKQVIISAQNGTSEDKHNLTSPHDLLIFADENGIASQLVSMTEDNGSSCKIVYPGKNFEVISDNEVKINPLDPLDYKKMFEWISVNQNPFPYKLVCSWSMDEKIDEETNSDGMNSSSLRICRSATLLIQAILEYQLNSELSIYFVTSNAQPVDKSSVTFGLSQSTLWGLARSVALEHPEFKVKRIDLDLNDLESSLKLLYDEINSSETEDQVAFRGSERYVARLVRSDLQNDPASPLNYYKINSKKTYLITGGLGSVGLKFAKLMVENGARHLVLINRRKLNNPIVNISPREGNVQDKITELKSFGAKIDVVQADVGDFIDISELFEKFEKAGTPISGILHAAGINEEMSIKNMNLESIQRMFKPKVLGAWNLHLLTKNKDIDFLLFFSSASSIWGAKDQGHYGAANRFLDALAHYRNFKGLPALSINWGVFPESTLISDEYRAWLSQLGFLEFDIEEAFKIILSLLSERAIQRAVVKVQWDRFRNVFETIGLAHLFELINEKQEVKNIHLENETKLSANDGQKNIIKILKEEVASTLGINYSKFNEHDSLNLLGLDSLIAVGLRNRLNKKFSIDIPLINFMDGSSIIDLQNLINNNEKNEGIGNDLSDLILNIKQEVANILGYNVADIEENKPLNELGLDSLIAVGLRNRLNKNFGHDIPLVKFMDGSSLADLAEQITGENKNNDSEIVGGII